MGLRCWTAISAALGIAALLAIGTGLRFYLVTRLGERVVADIRRALFDRCWACRLRSMNA
jgi:ATP-binding cassette, subfamily B, bacterial